MLIKGGRGRANQPKMSKHHKATSKIKFRFLNNIKLEGVQKTYFLFYEIMNRPPLKPLYNESKEKAKILHNNKRDV